MHQTHLYRKWQREKKKKWSTGDCRCVIMPFNCARATLCTHTSRQQTYEAMPPPNTICSRQKKNRIFRVRVHCSYALLSRSHCARATLTPHTETYNTSEQRTCLNRSISDVDINENWNWILIGRKSNCSTRNRWMRRWCSMQSNTVYHLQQSAIDSLKCFCVLCHFTRKFILLFNAITGHKQCVCVSVCASAVHYVWHHASSPPPAPHSKIDNTKRWSNVIMCQSVWLTYPTFISFQSGLALMRYSSAKGQPTCWMSRIPYNCCDRAHTTTPRQGELPPTNDNSLWIRFIFFHFYWCLITFF